MNLISSAHALVATATTSSGSKSSSGSSPTFLIVLVVIFGGLYFLVIRPSQRRRMAATRINKAYEVGDEVIAGGIVGRVVRIGEGEVDVDAGDGVFTFVSQAVQSRAAFVASNARRGAAGQRGGPPALPPRDVAGEDHDDDVDDDDDVDEQDEDDFVADEHTDADPSGSVDGQP